MPQGQLTLHEREMIACWHHRGESVTAIARRLDRHHATISRELRRNRSPSGEYLPASAHQRAFARRSSIRRGRDKICDNKELRSHLEHDLREHYWSPDIIAGRLRRDHPDDPSLHVSTAAIYRWIRRDQYRGGTLHCCLAYGKRGYRRRGSRNGYRGKIPNRVGIDERPAVVDELGRFGDWESDTIHGKGHRGAIATHVERRSKYTVLALLPDLCADSFSALSRNAFRRHQAVRALPLHTLTADNGNEFANHEALARWLGAPIYFAHPYRSCERARNENMNRMVRQWFPKGLDFRSLHDVDVQSVERRLNQRPRKSLGYRTPAETLLEEALLDHDP